MNQTKLIVRLALSVLSAGLVSCAKDEKVRDTFKAPPPVINQNGAQDLKAWDRRSDKSLDLQDSFDVSAGHPARLQVNSYCRSGGLNYYEGFTFVPRAPIKIFQVLPPALLTSDIVNQKIECSFELTLMNDVGSKHIYQISSTPVTDVTGPLAKLEKTASEEKITQIHARKLEGVRVRFRNAGSAAAQIFCQDMTLPDLPFEQVIDLIHFNFAAPELKNGRHPEVLTDNPVQPCRMLIRQSGQIQQISQRFLVQLPQKPLQVNISSLPPSVAEKEQLGTGKFLDVGWMVVSNPDRTGDRYLSVGKVGTESIIYVYTPEQSGSTWRPHSVGQYNRSWFFALPESNGPVTAEDKGDHYKVTIPAGKGVAMLIQIRPAGSMKCKGLITPTKNISVSGKLEFLEIGVNSEPLEKIRAELPLTSYMQVNDPPAAVPGTCVW